METIKIFALLITLAIFTNLEKAHAKNIYVSQTGSDNNAGTIEKPFLSFEKAVSEMKKFAGKVSVNIWFTEGTYYITKTIQLTPEYSGTEKKSILFSALPGHNVKVKGSMVLDQLNWKAYKNGIFVSQIPAGLSFDQLFINGVRQVRARFPNYDEQNPIRGGNGYQKATGGTDKRYDQWFSFDPNEFTKKVWAHPETGIVHAFQSHNWGNLQYRIKAVDNTTSKILLGEGGWQLQRINGIGKASVFYIDNIFEELDTPSEWFLDEKNNLLYFYPSVGVNLKNVTVEVPIVKDMIQLKGNNDRPIKHISFKGLNFSQSKLTFMEQYEPLARGDWAIHRGGVVFMEGAENCNIKDCSFDYVGGNGVFMSGYNRDNKVSGCRFMHTGESAVCLVGSPLAVRLYQTWDDKDIKGISWKSKQEGMDTKPGPKTPDYPENCVVENCIMHDIGDFGKQVAAVFISMSHKIRVSHCTIYNCPRAGICINDGTWGGHIIENCDIWETVRETGEHGPFNSWGRERFWPGTVLTKHLVKLDAIDPTIVRNNRIANFRESISAGNWTIDLDDGSSYFEIYNNLNLGSTIKLRDGFFRKVYNNICVSAVPLGWHAWPEDSEDEIFRNIFVISGAVPGSGQPTTVFARPLKLPNAKKWSNNYNFNTYWNINSKTNPSIIQGKSFTDWQAQGYDLQSTIADPLFVNPQKGDYRVKENSPALKLGFKNFPMDQFGHTMTNIEPFGGNFSDELSISIKPDVRLSSGGTLRYTIDGSEPTPNSSIYKLPFVINQSCFIKAQSFGKHGNPIGFACEAKFNKTANIHYPSWYNTLLAGKYEDGVDAKLAIVSMFELDGAVLINIADDPDLIDATGGFNFGCYIESIDSEKGKLWKEAGFEPGWIIQKINGKEVRTVDDLRRYMTEYTGKTLEITAVQNYKSRIFKMQLK